jgi:oxygen-independent coproporphyrinogen-3 oxidase
MKCAELNYDLVRKYNLPVPRYTSYPTVPFWNNDMNPEKWQIFFVRRFHEQNHTDGISLYIHLPFCESLCTYCGCNKRITTNHSVEEEYLLAIEKEWKLYKKLMRQTPIIRELHLGGGTPTFFSPRNLKRLIEAILKGSITHPQREFSIEGHPNNTTPEHLKMLYNLCFRRISYGVQDNDPVVQRAINRIQPFENVKAAIDNARAVGFTSVNFDLIYGLPFQTEQSMERTINQVISLKPDRIAFYSYAHVPWTSKAQRLFDETNLPTAEEKIALYLKGKGLLLENGYFDIGMDHFALPHDDLYKAYINGKLHRNFMGYTTQNSGMLLGLGVSSISDAGYAYAQNHKTIHDYYAAVKSEKLATCRGYELSEEDISFRSYILQISCSGRTFFKQKDKKLLQECVFPQLVLLAADGLIIWNEQYLELTANGRYFIRNVCAAFDIKLHQSEHVTTQAFSKAI